MSWLTNCSRRLLRLIYGIAVVVPGRRLLIRFFSGFNIRHRGVRIVGDVKKLQRLRLSLPAELVAIAVYAIDKSYA